MYAMLLNAHVGLAVLALVLTLGWAAVVVATTGAPGRLSRTVYIGAMASTGLAGVTGVVLALAGGFATMAFPSDRPRRGRRPRLRGRAQPAVSRR